VSIAANPPATAAALAAFLAVPLTFERVMPAERFLVLAVRFGFVLPRCPALAPVRFDDDFAALRLTFFMLPPDAHHLWHDYRFFLRLLELR